MAYLIALAVAAIVATLAILAGLTLFPNSLWAFFELAPAKATVALGCLMLTAALALGFVYLSSFRRMLWTLTGLVVAGLTWTMAATYGSVPLIPPNFKGAAGDYSFSFETLPAIDAAIGQPIIITIFVVIAVIAVSICLLEGLQMFLDHASREVV
ncbi:hypothetical protein [Devosia neptuniae]|jgi:hypothetical protein|uniref:hypothetical protein n=1 Tax=Devosia TaxID=46913 RepID=UPI0022AF06AA|nr:hypothetical protein [Devosia neptuniae]MCZ4345707.1 hypothetical protein [Devosia neptuniae]|tara:strand:+ start:1180 stop:1644 length:465 start_codon:yes stop_codon:yes gene_type:complete